MRSHFPLSGGKHSETKIIFMIYYASAFPRFICLGRFVIKDESVWTMSCEFDGRAEVLENILF